jgi:hypothetical protein
VNVINNAETQSVKSANDNNKKKIINEISQQNLSAGMKIKNLNFIVIIII